MSPEKVSTVHVTESPGIMKSDINILRQLSAHQMKGLCQQYVLFVNLYNDNLQNSALIIYSLHY